MKAAVYIQYGPPQVLHIADVAKPVPGAGEVLVRVHATTVNRTDCGFRGAHYFISRLVTGLVRPRRIIGGSEFAGTVVAVGEAVTEYEIGDRVFAFDDVRAGGHAEYVAVAESGPMAKIPEGFQFHDMAAAGEGAAYALNVIGAAGIRKGQKVLVYGASGAIGSAAVQILKSMGVAVTAVCGTKCVALISSLRADRVISYEEEDFTQLEERFDLVFDAVGKSSYGACKHLLARRGIYYSTELGKGAQNPLLALWFAITRSRKVIFPVPKINNEVIAKVRELVATGAFKPVIDRTYLLDDIVEAARYVETGQKIGNVVVSVVGE